MAFPAATVETPRCVEENLAYQFQLLQVHNPQQTHHASKTFWVLEVEGDGEGRVNPGISCGA